MAAGYSGTPLAKKLGIKEGMVVAALDAPKNYRDLLAPLPAGVKFVTKSGAAGALVHLFVTEKSRLGKALVSLRKTLDDEAALWISWPKKASKMPTDISEDTIRELALPLGFVDIKVCAVDETWSGLKLVVRKELRGK
jgi:hypothetical protein